MVGGVMRDLLSVRRRGPPNSPHNQTPAYLLRTASRQRRGAVCRLSATGSGMARHEPRIEPRICSFVLVASAAGAAKSEPYRDFCRWYGPRVGDMELFLFLDRLHARFGPLFPARFRA